MQLERFGGDVQCSQSNPQSAAAAATVVRQARPEQVKMQLLNEGLELEEFGGDVQCVQTAAKAGLGLKELEEALLLQVGAG
jgi:translation initiation factor IF-2